MSLKVRHKKPKPDKPEAKIDFEQPQFIRPSTNDIKFQLPTLADVTDWMYRIHTQARKSRDKEEKTRLKRILNDLHTLRVLIK